MRTRSHEGESRRPAEEELPTVFVEPFVDEGLGNSAYLVGSRASKVAALIDPLRDVDHYVDAATRLGVKITHVLDTHLHNDFVSGAREVAAETGAVIGASATAGLEFDHQRLSDGDRLLLGNHAMRAIVTPGHTPESISFSLLTPDDTPIALFSGGALIVGGAARTDLLGHDLSEPLARKLYHTIHDRLLSLPDEVVVCPTHGAGSFCAAPTGGPRTTTIGQERRSNPLCQPQTEDEFVAHALAELPSYPTYFRELRPINRRGPKVLGGVPEPSALKPEEVKTWADGGGAVLDIRPPRMFVAGHIPGAYGISLGGGLATWVGWLVPFGTPLVLVANGSNDLREAVRELIRIGFDDVRGHLAGGMEAWVAAGLPLERVRTMSPSDLRRQIATGGGATVVDVRFDDEWDEGHIPGALHLENGRLPTEDFRVPPNRPIVVHCSTLNRSTAGISVLARRGYTNLVLLDGGFRAWEASGFEVERRSGGKV